MVKRAAATAQVPRSGALTKQDFEALARFRSGIRHYLRFSEETVVVTNPPPPPHYSPQPPAK